MLKIFLIRHADTEIHSFSGKDIERVLSKKGIAQCAELKSNIEKYNWQNVDFYVSSSERTKQTFQLIFGDKVCTFDNSLYLASAENLLKYINNLNATNSMCIIAHNEGISALATQLTGQRFLMNTASFLELHFDFESTCYISAETALVANFIF
jgi:phosphohistidine phosphatase